MTTLREDIAELLNGEWPHCFNDGFQDAVAGVICEHLTSRGPDGADLLRRLREGNPPYTDAGDVALVVSEWLAAAGIEDYGDVDEPPVDAGAYPGDPMFPAPRGQGLAGGRP